MEAFIGIGKILDPHFEIRTIKLMVTYTWKRRKRDIPNKGPNSRKFVRSSELWCGCAARIQRKNHKCRKAPWSFFSVMLKSGRCMRSKESWGSNFSVKKYHMTPKSSEWSHVLLLVCKTYGEGSLTWTRNYRPNWSNSSDDGEIQLIVLHKNYPVLHVLESVWKVRGLHRK